MCFKVAALTSFALEFQVTKAKVLYLVSVLLKLCTKKLSKYKRPWRQWGREGFVTTGRTERGLLSGEKHRHTRSFTMNHLIHSMAILFLHILTGRIGLSS